MRELINRSFLILLFIFAMVFAQAGFGQTTTPNVFTPNSGTNPAQTPYPIQNPNPISPPLNPQNENVTPGINSYPSLPNQIPYGTMENTYPNTLPMTSPNVNPNASPNYPGNPNTVPPSVTPGTAPAPPYANPNPYGASTTPFGPEAAVPAIGTMGSGVADTATSKESDGFDNPPAKLPATAGEDSLLVLVGSVSLLGAGIRGWLRSAR